MLTTFTLIAGIGLGTSACLAFMLYREMRTSASLDRERMLWANKTLVRQGQVPVFTAEMLGEVRLAETSHTPMQVKSPFRAGLEQLKESIRVSKKGPQVPDEVKERIEQAAEARRGETV